MIPLGLALLVAGALVVALPDDDERLFSFSRLTARPGAALMAGVQAVALALAVRR